MDKPLPEWVTEGASKYAIQNSQDLGERMSSHERHRIEELDEKVEEAFLDGARLVLERMEAERKDTFERLKHALFGYFGSETIAEAEARKLLTPLLKEKP